MVQLDLLRGIAILLVLWRHSVLPWSFAGILQRPALCLYHLGWTGVDLFFVLSGFLIGGLLFNEIRHTGHLKVRRFLVRRGFKIWPAYLFFIAYVFLLVGWQNHSVAYAAKVILPNLLHLQNYLYPPVDAMVRGDTWSLAVEEHFYLVLPLVLIGMLRFYGRRAFVGWAIPCIAIFLALACTICRILINPHLPFDWWHIIVPTHTRIDGLFFGVMLAQLYHMRPAFLASIARHRWMLISAGLLLVLPMAVIDQGDAPWVWTIGLTMLYVGYGCILIALVYTQPGDGLLGKIVHSAPARLVALIGVFSYSIYLWQREPHLLLTAFVHPSKISHHLSLYWMAVTAIYIGGSIALGVIMAKLIEMPLLALREKLFPRTEQAIAAPAHEPEPKAQSPG